MNKAFLKWAGGKSQLVPTILSLIPEKHSGCFIEPFVGSGVVALNAPFPEICIGDTNVGLMDVWMELRANGPTFIDQCKALFTAENNTKEQFYILRKEFNETVAPARKAALFIYLNRHCFNGLCRFNSSGYFNVPFGKYTKPYFPEAELKAAVEVIERSHVCMGLQDFVRTMEGAEKGDVIYCDPPYIPLSETSNFTAYSAGGFGMDQQHSLMAMAEKCQRRGVTVIISNNDVPAARKLYKDATEIHSVQVRKAISCKGDGRKKSGEILVVYRP